LVEGEMLITNKDQLQAAYKLPTLSDWDEGNGGNSLKTGSIVTLTLELQAGRKPSLDLIMSWGQREMQNFERLVLSFCFSSVSNLNALAGYHNLPCWLFLYMS
jgi:hypothetical protein